MADVPHKMVDGVVVPLTPQEIAEFEAQGAKAKQQQNVVTLDPGAGPTYKQTLGVLIVSALDLIATSRNPEFSSRVLMIGFKVAQMVATEDPGTEHNAERVAYAGLVIRGDEHQQMMAAHVVSSNPTIGAAIESQPELYGANVPDGDIEFALASIWTARAIAFANQ